jgi:hypothetical protein
VPLQNDRKHLSGNKKDPGAGGRTRTESNDSLQKQVLLRDESGRSMRDGYWAAILKFKKERLLRTIQNRIRHKRDLHAGSRMKHKTKGVSCLPRSLVPILLCGASSEVLVFWSLPPRSATPADGSVMRASPNSGRESYYQLASMFTL